MTTPVPLIQTMTEGSLMLETFDAECWINSAVLSQSTDFQDVKTLCASTTGSAPSTTAYSLAVTYFVDEQAGAISDFLWTNHSTQVSFTFQPFTDPATTYTGTCWAMWGGTGGASGELAQVDVEFPCVGRPTRTAAP